MERTIDRRQIMIPIATSRSLSQILQSTACGFRSSSNSSFGTPIPRLVLPNHSKKFVRISPATSSGRGSKLKGVMREDSYHCFLRLGYRKVKNAEFNVYKLLQVLLHGNSSILRAKIFTSMGYEGVILGNGIVLDDEIAAEARTAIWLGMGIFPQFW